MSERLCVFCVHFQWKNETQWGMGSTQTGPMLTGGYAKCKKGLLRDHKMEDESDWRKVIVTARTCPAYTPPVGS